MIHFNANNEFSNPMSYRLRLIHLFIQTFLFHSTVSTSIRNSAPVGKSVLPESNDHFKKYWPTLDQFIPCKIYFSRSPNATLEMHDSFLERCRSLGYCTAIQSSYTKPLYTHESVLAQLWNRTDFKHLLSTFWNIFAAHRLHSVCTIQLNFNYYDPIDRKGDHLLFAAVSPYQSYIILPTDFKLNSTHLRYITGPSLATSKLICLNRNFSAIFTSCLTCAKVISYNVSKGQFGYSFHKPLIKLSSSQISKTEFDAIWTYYHSNKNNLLKKTSPATKITQSYNDYTCENYLSGDTHSQSLNPHCFTNIIKTFFNFSQLTNRDINLSPFEEFGRTWRRKRRFLQPSPSASGTRYNGIRFSIFVKPNHKYVGNTLVALLTPFSYLDWAFVATTIFLLATTLKLTGFHISHALFWIIVSVLEQGEYRREHVINKNKHLIISWLFVAFLFRNFYTSDLYSNLTKKPRAQNLPKSFKELILNHSLPILSIAGHRPYLVRALPYDETRNDYPFNIYRRLNVVAYWL